MNKTILRGAIMTVLTLFGGIAIGIFLGDLVFHLLPVVLPTLRLCI